MALGSDIYVVTATSGLNVRSTPSTQGRIVRTIPHGTELDVVEVDGNWAKVDMGASKDCYVSIKYLKYLRTKTTNYSQPVNSNMNHKMNKEWIKNIVDKGKTTPGWPIGWALFVIALTVAGFILCYRHNDYGLSTGAYIVVIILFFGSFYGVMSFIEYGGVKYDNWVELILLLAAGVMVAVTQTYMFHDLVEFCDSDLEDDIAEGPMLLAVIIGFLRALCGFWDWSPGWLDTILSIILVGLFIFTIYISAKNDEIIKGFPTAIIICAATYCFMIEAAILFYVAWPLLLIIVLACAFLSGSSDSSNVPSSGSGGKSDTYDCRCDVDEIHCIHHGFYVNKNHYHDYDGHDWIRVGPGSAWFKHS